MYSNYQLKNIKHLTFVLPRSPTFQAKIVYILSLRNQLFARPKRAGNKCSETHWRTGKKRSTPTAESREIHLLIFHALIAAIRGRSDRMMDQRSARKIEEPLRALSCRPGNSLPTAWRGTSRRSRECGANTPQLPRNLKRCPLPAVSPNPFLLPQEPVRAASRASSGGVIHHFILARQRRRRS